MPITAKPGVMSGCSMKCLHANTTTRGSAMARCYDCLRQNDAGRRALDALGVQHGPHGFRPLVQGYQQSRGSASRLHVSFISDGRLDISTRLVCVVTDDSKRVLYWRQLLEDINDVCLVQLCGEPFSCQGEAFTLVVEFLGNRERITHTYSISAAGFQGMRRERRPR